MKKYIYIISLLTLMIIPGCDFMDELPTEWHTPEAAFQLETTYERNINQGYAYIRNGYNRIGSAFLDAATNDASATIQNSNIHKLAQGFYNEQSPIIGVWTDSYKGIRQTLFTEKYLKEVQLFLNNKSLEEVNVIKKEGIAQMWALRALYELDLLQHYGGYPIIDSYMEITDPRFNTIKRDSFATCVKNIVTLCDSAAIYLSVKHASFGRMEKGTAMAIKAKALVYAASALYNRPDNTNPLVGYVNASALDVENRWKAAAEALAAVINLKSGATNRYVLHTSYATLFNTCPNNEYIVFFATGKSNGLENRQYPPSLANTSGGGTVPSQQFVDAFTNADGTTYTRAEGAAPTYTGRDPRFNMIVGYNGASYGTRGNIYTQLGTDETSDGLNKVKDFSTNTGYYLKKFLDTNINFKVGTPTTTYHLYPYIRLADVLLMYAEAMTQAYGFETDPALYGLTAKQAVELVRKRAGFNNTTDQYFVGATTKELQLQKIYDERRIELSFEEARYFDLRRWMKTDVLSEPIKGMRVDNNAGTLTFTEFTVDDERVFEEKMYFAPISKNEILVFPALEQNPGWQQ
jgi:starch-binding outer membrane protein, SusD/RagB family